MKKMMCVGAATMLLTAFADIEGRAPQVYDLSITVKTTAAKKATLSSKSNKFLSDSETVVYRVQASKRWKGLIWGCDCDAVAGKWRVVDTETGSVAGCVIWDTASPNKVLFLDNVNWRLLNAIDKKGDKCEGSYTIGTMDADSEAFLTFAGFGTLSISYTEATACSAGAVDCRSYIKQMAGNVAGWMPAPSVTTAGTAGSCTFCGEYDPGEAATTDVATAWNFCPCEDFADLSHTAVSGTWTLKYNARASSSLKQTETITDAVSLPENVRLEVAQKIQATR